MFRDKVTDRLSDALEFPIESLGNYPIITLIANKEAKIENINKIKCYRTDIVILSAARYVVNIHGESLRLKVINDEHIVVAGNILSVEVK